MVSGPITSWEIDGETVETVADFIFGGSEITADGDCSDKIKRRLLLLLLSRFSNVRLCATSETAARNENGILLSHFSCVRLCATP